jgi:hypothetical protein
MMDRRQFCGSTLASAFLSGRLAAALPDGLADHRLSVAFDAFYDTALSEVPEFATIFGIDTDARAGLKSKLHDGSLAGVERRRGSTRRRSQGSGQSTERR